MKFHPRLLLVLAACFISTTAIAEQGRVSNRDKSQIIRTILRAYDFTHSGTWHDNQENTILLLDENISPTDVPSRRGMRFRIVKQAEIDQLRKNKTGVEYYELRPFEVLKVGVRVFFIRRYFSPGEGNGSAMEYTCRKVAGRWKLKARLDGVFAS